ncbi:hypothetical protein XMM379_002037 [Aliiroseovarius sp. xm-m-379]|nr:hypothetical protein [Aliiroseovarius sp. xm-d-517]NRP25341.1 hypothetical protein [Aliiroseovarius sp. xm-m-379]NRP30931.1 hypothetical protein [Aliiroseovarius sp. xm-m-314]NRP34140.1 hypothetical protein [Aliiroseovarius sp. xm-a-104]NRP41393.1 hypothetical protein [Aliiroseovarius sp. xm-m-339-2]NRP44745.1 hypothetical protein [Aliiroseovarius sp. xm-m-378]NRP50681.1 hypothetical protein [Aliiroseovarius sp. xm-m-354]NRP62399.1 hypothetical protein [Aliiroseovarius sp. xm-a-151]NRP65
MRHFLLIAMLVGPAAQADVTAPSGRVIDCYCTDSQGGRVELGQEICLFVDGRAFMALCDMSLNVPIWRDTGRACLSSRLGIEQLEPVGEPGSIDPKI